MLKKMAADKTILQKADNEQLEKNNIKALGRRMTMNNNKWPKWCGEDTRCDEVGEEGCCYLNDDGECIKTVKQAGDE